MEMEGMGNYFEKFWNLNAKGKDKTSRPEKVCEKKINKLRYLDKKSFKFSIKKKIVSKQLKRVIGILRTV